MPFAHFLIGWFVFLLFSCIIFFYILEINLLLDVSLTNMFSHSVGLLLILLMISFIVKKAFKPDVVPLVYFFFCFHYQRRYIGKNIAIRDVWDLTAYVSFWVFLIQPIRSAFLSIFSSDEKKNLISIMTFITISSCCAFFSHYFKNLFIYFIVVQVQFSVLAFSPAQPF